MILEELKGKWKSILEIGCADGINLLEIKREYPDRIVKGVDTEMFWDEPDYTGCVMKAISRGLDVSFGDARKLPYKDNSFDIVFSKALLVMTKIEDYPLIIKEALRVAKKKVFFIELHSENKSKTGEYYWQSGARTRFVADFKGYLNDLGYKPIVKSIPKEIWDWKEDWGSIIIVNL